MSFAQLPFELRTYIWSLTDIEPRCITNHRRKGLDILYETTSAPPPAVVQVCREARQYAPYRRAFTAGTEPRWTWVNFALDIFCVSSIMSLGDIKSHRGEIQRLHIRTDDDEDWYYNLADYNAMRPLCEFDSLVEVRTVLEPGDWWWGEIWADESSGLVLSGPQLRMVRDWHFIFSFDSDGNPPSPERLLSDEIAWAWDETMHLTFAQMYYIG
ncbi:uncharacterized protein F5Z01DRAFT_680327 [Emericellopsis atlantica]|uniref:2EXR domain-containing protein n=1 Tax=Emericellopsis atlantica TaxID=2614577 RepID=A0A9P7ZQD3_9HYPO|nr:uncharacterized protein F5Z01DRAFT_680327 [Emericellopsis atlantica]KAG9256373.1 hypothetical protein F5Z01DRAFT_680327 [Emericellopsis atlantica]